MKQIHVLMLTLLFILPAQSGKRPFTISDLYKIKSVSDPHFSPDGKKIAFVVTESFLEEGKTNPEIYMMNSDGSSMVNISNDPSSDTHPRWSPDGTSLLFVSTRKNGPQIWLVASQGGLPRQLTSISTGAGDPEWFPDSKRILFSSDVYPECGSDDTCNKTIDSTVSGGPIQAHMADRLLYRHWNFWKDRTRTHTFLLDVTLKNYTDITPGDFDCPSWEMGGGGFDCSPDGREICYVSNHDTNEAETTNKDLWIVQGSAGGGTPRDITKGNEAYDGSPAYSPDGKYIGYKVQTIPGYEADRFRLAIYNRQTQAKLTVTEYFDYWVGDFRWSPDSKSIYFTAQVQGHTPIYRVDIKSKVIVQIIDVKTVDAFDVSPDGKWLVFARRSVGEPLEIWRASAEGKNLKQLTSINRDIADEVDIRPAEEIWVNSPTGKKIHTFIVKPYDFDDSKKYPLILNVHGGPQMQWADAFRGDWQVYPGSGYIVAFPNPHGSTGYGQEFTAEISKDFGGKVYTDIMAVADSLSRIPWVDSDRMGAMGWSYGGYMMMWLEGHTDRFKAIASMMGMYNLTAFHGSTEELWFPEWDFGGTPWTSDLYQKWSPNRFVQKFKTPCLVITGEKDFRIPYTQSLEFFTDLQIMGVPSRLIVFTNDGHWPNAVKSMPLYYNAHLDWFHTYLGGAPPPYDMNALLRNRAFGKKEK